MPSWAYSYGGMIYTPGIAQTSGGAGGTNLYTNVDALGSVHDTQTNGNATQDALRTDAFGGAVARQGSDTLNLGFAASSSYQMDSDTGLMLLGNRYYDPSTGRFMSQDPSGDGDNWYAYCGNDPLDGVDPEGLTMQGAAPTGADFGNPGMQMDNAFAGMNGFAGMDRFIEEDERHRTVTTTMTVASGGTTSFTQTAGPWSDWQPDGNFRLAQSTIETPEGVEEMMAEVAEGGRFDEGTLQSAYRGIQEWAVKKGIPLRPAGGDGPLHAARQVFARFGSLKILEKVWNSGAGFYNPETEQYILWSRKLGLAIIYDPITGDIPTVIERATTRGWVPYGRGFMP